MATQALAIPVTPNDLRARIGRYLDEEQAVASTSVRVARD